MSWESRDSRDLPNRQVQRTRPQPGSRHVLGTIRDEASLITDGPESSGTTIFGDPLTHSTLHAETPNSIRISLEPGSIVSEIYALGRGGYRHGNDGGCPPKHRCAEARLRTYSTNRWDPTYHSLGQRAWRSDDLCDMCVLPSRGGEEVNGLISQYLCGEWKLEITCDPSLKYEREVFPLATGTLARVVNTCCGKVNLVNGKPTEKDYEFSQCPRCKCTCEGSTGETHFFLEPGSVVRIEVEREGIIKQRVFTSAYPAEEHTQRGLPW